MTTRPDNPPPRRPATFAAAPFALALVLALPGCRSASSRAHGERFPADDEPRTVDAFVHVQSAAAARADATLTPHHFDGRGGLNSLGRHKLDLMLRDDDASAPLVVYLDLPAAAAPPGAAPAAAHTESVRVYLVDRGVPESQVELRGGPNLAYRHPASDGLRGLRRFEADAASPDAADAPTPPTADKANAMTNPGGR
jgi:hypothetical protein